MSLQDWQVQGSLAPLLHLVHEETDSAAVSVLLGGTGQVCAERGWTGQNPSLEDAAAIPVTSNMEPWMDSWPGTQDTWVLTLTLPHKG